MRKLQNKIINTGDKDNKLSDKLLKNAASIMSGSQIDIDLMSAEDIKNLLFDLQTHQIELKMQNEELNRVHQELIVSRDSYAQLYDLSPVAYLTLNEVGGIENCNVATSVLLGQSKQALIGQKFAGFIHSSDQDNYYLFLRSLLANKVDQVFDTKLENICASTSLLYPVCQFFQVCPGYKCESEFCNKCNLLTYIKCSVSVNSNDNSALQILMVLDNVTELKYSQASIICLNEKLEEKILRQTDELIGSNFSLQKKIDELSVSKNKLMEREAKFNAIFNASVEGIITVGHDDCIVSANAAVEVIFGYKPEELKGRSIKILMPFMPELIKQNIGQQLITETGNIREVEGLHKNGKVVFLDLSIAEFSTDKERYFTHIVRDVSSRKLLEQQDREHLDQLAHVTRLGLMGEMASGIAHEVNQPLAAISNYTQASMNLIAKPNLDLVKLVDILSKTQQQALRAGKIIHRMRNFVKSHTLYRSAINLNDLIHDALDLCMPELKQNNISFKFELETDLPPVYVDKIQIEQVLINLIRNSVNAMQKQLLTQKPQLTIEAFLIDSNKIQVRVKDNGHGIEHDQQQNILTPFFTTKADGMGMGLSISRSIVEAHEGSLHFNSLPGKGTTFYFTLPIWKDSYEQ